MSGTAPKNATPRWRAPLGIVGLAVVVAFLAIVVIVGPGTTWRWIDAQWRLDIGAPSHTDPYPDHIAAPLARLAVAGDVGTGGSAERETAAVMDSLESTGEFDALLLLGDNVYPNGDPSSVEADVLEPFAAVLDGPTALVATLGNHDVRTGDGTGQIEALGLPGRWYAERFGPVRVVVVDSTRASDADQLAWLDEELSTPTDATWTVIIQHHPPFSAGYHGSHGPSRQHLVPLYEEYGVDLVLAGHDHDYQHIEAQHGVTYVVSGGAAKLRNTAAADFTVVAASTYHFVELAAYDTHLDVRAVDHDGRLIDAFSLPAR